jgi:ABC-type uncharacterized transport system ATPase subunit
MSKVELRGIRKTYGPVTANRDVNLTLRPGTIHGILGENGAGKSTAMKILYGLETPDAGEIWIDDRKAQLESPLDARALGIGMVHQHFVLADEHSVLENIILGQEPVSPFCQRLPGPLQRIDHETAKAKIQTLMSDHELTLPLETKAGELSLGERQRLELLKLLYGQARIIILDEPTAVLSPAEIDGFFDQIRRLAQQGCSVLIVTHKLRELLSLCDDITIFRQGMSIATVRASDVDADRLASLMIGQRYKPVRNDSPNVSQEKSFLKIEGLRLTHKKSALAHEGLTLSLAPGEILGIAGVDNNGQEELSQALRNPQLFLKSHACKTMVFDGHDMSRWSTEDVLAAQIGHIPADRHRQGLDLSKSARDNFALTLLHRKEFRWGPFIRWKKVSEACRLAMESCDVQPAMPDLLAGAFSGGNQQKLIFARETFAQPKLLIAMQVTRGVDIGAIQLLHQKLLDLRAQGTAILLISSELDEILALSDRIAVLENYRIVLEKKASECDETMLGLAMSGSLTHSHRVPNGEDRL